MEQNIESDLQIAKLNEKQQEMDLLLDGMSEGFLALDPQHRIVRANHSVLNMLVLTVRKCWVARCLKSTAGLKSCACWPTCVQRARPRPRWS